MRFFRPNDFNITVVAGERPQNFDRLDPNNLTHELGMLKTAILYGDQVRLISQTTGAWGDWLVVYHRLKDPPFEYKVKFLSETIGARGLLMSDTSTSQELRRFLRECGKRIDAGIPLRISRQSRRVVETVWDLTMERIEEYGPPGMSTIHKLHQSGHLSFTHLFDENDLSDSEIDRIEVRIECEVPADVMEDVQKTMRYTAVYNARVQKILDDSKQFPMFDRAADEFASIFNREANEVSAAPARRNIGPLAGSLFSRLPVFERATIDEVVDIRKELKPQLRRFQRAIATIASEIEEVPRGEFGKVAERIWMSHVIPELQNIEDEIESNKYLRTLTRNVLMKPEGLLPLGGVIFGVSQMTPEALIGTGLALAASPLKAAYEYQENMKDIKRNRFYFLHALGGKSSSVAKKRRRKKIDRGRFLGI